MSACVVYGCTNRITKRIPGITFHRFPSNEILKKAWILAVKRKDWNPTPYSRICSVHFSDDLLDRSLSRVYVKENAIPTIFPSYPTYKKNTEKPSKHRTQKEKDNDVSFEDSNFSKFLDTASDCNSASSEESPIQPCNTLSDKFNAQQLQSSDEDQQLQSSDEDQQLQSSDEDLQLQSSDEESESVEDINNFSETNVITFCDSSKQSSSPCNPSPFVTKVVNILNSSPSPVAAVKPPSCAESLQLIQNIFSRSNIKEDQAKDLIKRDIRRSSTLIETYCRKIKLMQKMLAIQEKKVEALKRVTSSIKRERIIE